MSCRLCWCWHWSCSWTEAIPSTLRTGLAVVGRYRMWKLRSMVVDADKRLQGHLDTNPEARAEWEETQKLRHDPRITRFGRLLRKLASEELV